MGICVSRFESLRCRIFVETVARFTPASSVTRAERMNLLSTLGRNNYFYY